METLIVYRQKNRDLELKCKNLEQKKRSCQMRLNHQLDLRVHGEQLRERLQQKLTSTLVQNSYLMNRNRTLTRQNQNILDKLYDSKTNSLLNEMKKKKEYVKTGRVFKMNTSLSNGPATNRIVTEKIEQYRKDTNERGIMQSDKGMNNGESDSDVNVTSAAQGTVNGNVVVQSPYNLRKRLNRRKY